MKNLLLFSFCFLFALNFSFAQTTGSSRSIQIKGTTATIDFIGAQTRADVQAIDANGQVLFEKRGLKVQTGG